MLLRAAPSLARRAASLPLGARMEFDHVQFFVDGLRPLDHYVDIEHSLLRGAAAHKDTWAKRKVEFSPFGQDLVTQLLFGANFRIAGWGPSHGSVNSVLLQSAGGSQASRVLVAAKAAPNGNDSPNDLPFLRASEIEKFMSLHAGRQGCSVLAFRLRDSTTLSELEEAYKNPDLASLWIGRERFAEGIEVAHAYAYYDARGRVATTDTINPSIGVFERDEGTTLRYLSGYDRDLFLPGFTMRSPSEMDYGLLAEQVPGDRDSRFFTTSNAAYPDHWVSNVVDRTSFVEAMGKLMGMEPKVDFNAGVVGAGDAVIESTVVGNNPLVALGAMKTASDVLQNVQQIYLPTNNALSDAGHVFQYVKQLGQGVQHIANKVGNLVAFVARANRVREVTGEGWTFLNIPKSYYGRLKVEALGLPDVAVAERALAKLQAAKIVGTTGVWVDYATSRNDVREALVDVVSDADQLSAAVEAAMESRYCNMKKLLGTSIFSEDEFVDIVKNQILVDIQGKDVLLQIFTCGVCGREAGHEAPFFEWMQRVCSVGDDNPVLRAGCGGFGIRNFITLFLSIEVSNAMLIYEKAAADGDAELKSRASRMIKLFEAQLEESNPILTSITDEMTAEAIALEEGKAGVAAACNARKLEHQHALVDVGGRYKREMAALREVGA